MGYYNGYGAPGTSGNGVYKWIQDKHIDLIPVDKRKDPNKLFSVMNKIMRIYLVENNLPCKDNGKHYSAEYNAIQIQKDFFKFAEWLKTFIPDENIFDTTR